MAKDLVCGMQVGERAAKNKSRHMGDTYYFCSLWCKEAFDKNPVWYIEHPFPELAATKGATACSGVPFFH